MKLYRTIKGWLIDPEHSYEERTHIMLAILGVFSMLVAAIVDIIIGENPIEIGMLIGMMVVLPAITVFCIKTGRMALCSVLSACALIFVILPVTFIFGGGTKGGGVYWIIFSYMVIGMSLAGVLRILMLFSLSFVAIGEFLMQYYHQEWISVHSVRMFWWDTLTSLLLVGVCTHVLLLHQKIIFKEESNRAHAETKRAEDMNRAQNRFFSSMSHEIRTPINSILGLNEVILRQEDASVEIRRDAANIQGAGRMLLTLINDILDYSKIEAGSMDIVPVDYRIGDLMSEIVNMIWLRASEKGLGFDVNIDPNVPSVLFGDEVRIKQIIINLLNNAVKYTQTGQIGLHIESERTGVRQVRLLIYVSDTGIGISKEAIPHLFDAFKRVDQEKNRYIEGTGLGLSIVKQLVDLMGGTISVNSIYGQGSTFTVSLLQEISDDKMLGNINIISQGSRPHKHEHLLTAPDARILIVDDNEMNLEVEKKLLSETEIQIDTAGGGAQALKATLERRYDVILMDHLMPDMDGIECLELIRTQTGGLNTDVPVIALTANGGSKNRELYNASGFDGYLVKPVSGHQLEEALSRHISREKQLASGGRQMNAAEMNTASGYTRMLPVSFCASSLCDLPDLLVKNLGIDILPHLIETDDGLFRDNVDISADEMVSYMEAGNEARSREPEVSAYVTFFGNLLKKSHHVIYISLTTSMSEDYARACEAARSFENVTVINSGSMSSCVGLMILAGIKLSQKNYSAERIAEELEKIKPRLHASFIMGTTEYMASRKLVGPKVHNFARTLELRPAIKYRKDKYGIDGLWRGTLRHCYDGYMRAALPMSANPDPEILFVTYVSIPEEDLLWIEEQLRRRGRFEHIIFQQASAAVTTNCGPGTFGLLYMDKGDKSYNLSSLLPKDLESREVSPTAAAVAAETAAAAEGAGNLIAAEYAGAAKKTETVTETTAASAAAEQKTETKEEETEMPEIEGLDMAAGIKNSGSPKVYRTVLRMFLEKTEENAGEIASYYQAEDWKNYTVKVHALKSSAALIGATALSEEAAKQEQAGKMDDPDYIREHHDGLLEAYRAVSKKIEPLFAKQEENPEASREQLDETYAEMLAAAKEMDFGRLDTAFEALHDYRIPPEDETLWKALQEACDALDYDQIAKLLEDRQNS